MSQYRDFISQIPENVLQKTESHLYNNIALFKPNVYLGKIKLDVSDYHIVVPSDNIPVTSFNDQIVHIDQGKMWTINPGDIVFTLEPVPTEPYYSFLIKPGLLQKIACEMGFCNEIRFQNFQNPFSFELLCALKNFEQELNTQAPLTLLLDSLEIQIGVLLLREFKTNIKLCRPYSSEADSYIHIASEYINTYYSSNITLQDICAEIHVSPYHFIRMFKQKVGVTPHRYLLNVRIEKAKELLKAGRHSVIETALLCGFESIPHFSATFKKSTGCSPVDYKNQA